MDCILVFLLKRLVNFWEMEHMQLNFESQHKEMKSKKWKQREKEKENNDNSFRKAPLLKMVIASLPYTMKLIK